MIGGRVTDGVSMLVQFLERPLESLSNSVLEKAVEAVVCLLCEAYVFNKEVAVVEEAFGTTDVRSIYAQTGGILSPVQHDALEKIVSARPQGRWTREHHEALSGRLNLILCSGFDLPEHIIAEAQRGLKDYPLSQKHDCA